MLAHVGYVKRLWNLFQKLWCNSLNWAYILICNSIGFTKKTEGHTIDFKNLIFINNKEIHRGKEKIMTHNFLFLFCFVLAF